MHKRMSERLGGEQGEQSLPRKENERWEKLSHSNFICT